MCLIFTLPLKVFYLFPPFLSLQGRCYIYLCVYVYMYHGTCVKAKGQLPQSVFSFHDGALTQIVRPLNGLSDLMPPF